MITRKSWLLAGCASMLAAYAAPAFAQEAANDEPTLVEEVIVTTERRAVSLQDTPLAVSAFTDEVRENVGIMTIQDMTQFTPGLSYNTSTDRPSIRGIGRQSNTFSIESPVASYFDGVYTSSVQDASRRPMFIERTEILRGPQGALSGKGSIAGAINTLSKRPRSEFEVEVGGLVANFQRWGVEGTVTGPITDSLRVRMNGGLYRQDEGFFKNVANGSTEGDQPNNRVIMDFLAEGEIGETFDYFFKASFADYDESRRSGGSLAPYIAGNNPCTPTPYGGLVPYASYGFFQPGSTCGTTGVFDNQAVILGGVRQNPAYTTGDLRLYNNDFRSDQSLDNHHNYTAELVWHAPVVDVKYIGGHQNYRYTQWTDADATPVESYVLPGAAARRVNVQQQGLYQEEREWYSNELNFSSTHEGPFQWIVGLYMSHEDYNQQPQSLWARGLAEIDNPYLGAGIVANPSSGRYQYGHLFGINDSRAVFGQIDYELNDKWKFTLGLRYNEDEKKVREQTRFVLAAIGGVTNTAFPYALDWTLALAPGFATVNPATAVIPSGYTLVDPVSGGACAPAAVSCALLSPGVLGLPTVDPATGYRHRAMKGEWDALQTTIGIDYTPNEDTLLYARVATGYRPGGFNAGFIVLSPMVDEESVKSYEVGGKFSIGSRLQLNTALFMYDYEDIQLPLATFERCLTPGDFSSCTAVNSFVNLPSGENKGFELEGTWYPTDNLQFVLSYGYLDAKIKDGLTDQGFEDPLDPAALLPTAQRHLRLNCVIGTANCANPGADGDVSTPGDNFAPGNTGGIALDATTGQARWTQDLSGNQLSNSPKHKVALNANYTFNLTPGDLTLSASYIWRDKAKGGLFGSDQDVTPAYDQTNLRAVFRDKDGRYRIIAYVQNVFDEDVMETAGVTRRSLGGAASTTNFTYFRTYDLANPRTFGLEFSRTF